MKRRAQDKKQVFSLCTKRAQMQLSFGMIFSIILIIVFVAFAVYAIIKFLDLQEGVQVGQFLNDLQNDVDKMWKSSQGSVEKDYRIPSGIDYVCLVDFNSPKRGDNLIYYDDLKMGFYEFENLIFYPVGSAGVDSYNLRHINLSSITGIENPLCIPNVKGKVKLTIGMNPGNSLVTITR